MEKNDFIKLVIKYYQDHKRILPWREQIEPYHVLLTEIMLQQTQVPRIMEKFPLFIKRFPSFQSLHEASLVEVLKEWQGLGYNRRGKYLKEIASIIHTRYKDIVPDDPQLLDELPGIGPATASAIVTYIYNKPEIFIETNIRRVFIHHFFKDAEEVADKEILPFVKETVDLVNPREWYFALMDYGTYLSSIITNPNRKSSHFKKQSKFEGSVRQVRGEILRLLLKEKNIKKQDFHKLLSYEESKCQLAIENLLKEGMIKEARGEYRINEK